MATTRSHVRRAVRRADRRDRPRSRISCCLLPSRTSPCCVLVLTESRGGDGIVANKDIRSIADLKGKTVAVPTAAPVAVLPERAAQGSRSERGGHRNGGSERRRRRRSLPDAGGGRRRDLGALAHAGQECRPWPPPADTSERPGPIVDCLTDQGGYLRRAPGGVPGAGARLGCGGGLYRAHPDEANEIMARNVAAGSRIRRSSPRPEGHPVLRWRSETESTSARRTTQGRSTRRCNTPSMSGRASACSRPLYARRRDRTRPLDRVARRRPDMSDDSIRRHRRRPLGDGRRQPASGPAEPLRIFHSPGSATGRSSWRRKRASSPRRASRSS